MHISVIKRVAPYTFWVRGISPLHPQMLAHVVPTVHGTRGLLVAREPCAQSHFIWFVGGMNSEFTNVELVSPILNKRNEKFIYICILLQRNKHDMLREDKKFTHNCRIFKNSWYLQVDKSQESNTRILPSFDCIWKAIQ